jgi:branched-chain amino acid transport system permease protein
MAGSSVSGFWLTDKIGRVGILAGVAILALLVAPLVLSPFELFSLSSILLLATLAVTWDFFTGLSGYFNFGHMFLVGSAGYTSALLVGEAGVSLPVAMVVATVLTTVVGTVVIAGPSLRLSGIYFAVVTLIVPIYAENLVMLFSDVTGGLGGYIFVAPLDLELQGVVPSGVDIDLVMYFITVANLLVILGFLVVAAKSELGIVLRSIRQEEVLVSSLGINPTKYKIVGFALTALFTAFTGALWTHFFATLTPTLQFSVDVMIDIVIAATIGGMGTVVGPALGMFVLEGIDFGLTELQTTPFIEETLSLELSEYRQLLGILVALGFLYFYPQGLYPEIKRIIGATDDSEGESE